MQACGLFVSRRSPMRARIVLNILVIALAVVLPAHAQSGDRDGLFEAVARSINDYTRFTIFDDVSVQVDEGAITLRGKVTMPFKRDDIGRRVQSVEGVTTVKNEIAVLPVSIYDDTLRR